MRNISKELGTKKNAVARKDNMGNRELSGEVPLRSVIAFPLWPARFARRK
jgi:hypothetical protein